MRGAGRSVTCADMGWEVAALCQITEDKPSIVWIFTCVYSSVNKFAKSESDLKKWLFHTPMIFKGFDTEKRGWGWNKIEWKHRGWITKYTEISFAKCLLPAAIISKALRCAGFKAKKKEWRHSRMDLNYENYFQLHERNDFRGFCKLNAIPIKKLEKQRHKLSNGSAHNTSIKRQKLWITNFLNYVRMLNRTTITDIKDNGSHFL